MGRGYTAGVPLCPNCQEDNPERAKFCLSCGTPLGEQPAPKREARKTVTVVFTDVAGFTSTAERSDPEAIRSFMARYFERMSAVVDRHGGRVEKFIGDAVMSVFGIPTLHEDDALRAVRAAWDMREALETLNDELETSWGVRLTIRTGVNTGEVVAGDPSSGQALVTGDAVNVAARLEQNAPAGGILIGEPTYRLVRNAVTVEPIDPVAAKGKTEPVKAFLLTGVTAGAPGVARRVDAPMVGRDHEQSLMMQAFERAVREHSCHLFTILGSAGVGKSRLVAAVLDALEDQATVLSGRCLPYGDGITFWPLMEAIPEVAGIRDDDPADVALAKISALARGDEHEVRIGGRIAEILDLAEGSASLEEQFWAVRRLFEHLARRRPLVVVFDDVHWAEPTFLDLVEHVADWTRDAPILLVCVARQELFDRRPGWGGGKFNATSIQVEPLSEKECDRLIQHLLGQADIEPAVRERITEAAEGNPLFVEETLSMLIDHGALRREHGRWVPTHDLSTVEVPPTIHALLAARIDRLRPEERIVLERASVVGKVFWRGAIVALSDDAEAASTDANLMVLVRKELIRQDRSTFSGEDSFRFRHLLIRDAAYGGVAKQVRADLHERFGIWLTGIAGDRVSEYEEILAYHYEQAYRSLVDVGVHDERTLRLSVEAGTRLAGAGRRAATRGDTPAAVTLLRRAIRALPEDHPTRLEVMPDLAIALQEAGSFAEASEIIEETEALARLTADEAFTWHARIARADLRILVAPEGATAIAREVASAAIEAFERLGDDRGLAKAWRLMSQPSWMAQQAEETRRALENAIEFGRRSGSRTDEHSMMSMLAMTMVFGPLPWKDAVERSEQLYRETQYRYMEADMLNIQAQAMSREGRVDEAREAWARSHSILEDLGLRFSAAGQTQGAAAIELDAGDLQRAADVLRRGAEELEEMGERAVASTNLGSLATIVADLGELAEAERLALRARELGDVLDAATQATWRQAMAKVFAARGDRDEAERLAREALEMVKGSDFLEFRADTLVHVALVFRTIGLQAEGDGLLATAEDLYAAKGATVRLQRTRALRSGGEA